MKTEEEINRRIETMRAQLFSSTLPGLKERIQTTIEALSWVVK